VLTIIGYIKEDILDIPGKFYGLLWKAANPAKGMIELPNRAGIKSHVILTFVEGQIRQNFSKDIS
jgi:hypothetical protein